MWWEEKVVEEEEDKESKRKKLFVDKPKETKQEKSIIVDPKVNKDLRKNVRKEVTYLEPEPKRRLNTRSKPTKPLSAKPKKILAKRNQS